FLRDRFTGPSGLSLRFLQLIRSFPTRFPLAGLPSGFRFPVFPTLSDPLSAEPIGVRISGSNSEGILQRFTEGIP
ncbi:hypothetical protein, partial [Streptantibioticus ferralitis]